MNVALSMWSVHQLWFDRQWETVDFIRFAADTQATGVELLSCFWRDKEAEIPQIQQVLEETGMKVPCFCACNNFSVVGEDAWNRQLADVKDSIDAANIFGAPVVRVFAGDKLEDATFEESRERIVRGLQYAAQYAEEKNVLLCLENHGLFAGKAEQVIDIIKTIGSPALGSTFDMGNFLLVGEDPLDAVIQLTPYIGHVHAKDFVRSSSTTKGVTYPAIDGSRFAGKVVGEGEVPVDKILDVFVANGYAGWYSVEFEGNDEPREGSTRSVRRLSDILNAR